MVERRRLKVDMPEETGDGPTDANTRLDEIAALDNLAYEQKRKVLAEELQVRVDFLDAERKGIRAEQKTEAPLFPHWVVEPWPEPVDTSALLSEVEEQINRYVATLGDRALVAALWVVWSWTHETATHSPLLVATSAEPDSGKTTLAGVVHFLTPWSLRSVNQTPAVLFRIMDHQTPTLIIDEADSVLSENQDIKEIVNSSWTRGQTVLRYDTDAGVVRGYPIFTPKMLVMKKMRGRIALPDTTLSRTIVLELKRKMSGEKVADFDHIDNADFAQLRRKLLRWGTDNKEIHKARPELPGYDNRLRMNWNSLIAIAELAGVQARAVKAARRIEETKTEVGLSLRLLKDIREIFDKHDVEKILTRTLIEDLVIDQEKPWADYSRGQPLNAKGLAKLLATYQIFSKEVHTDSGHSKGFERKQFEDAWDRYTKPPEGLGGPEPRSGATSEVSTTYNGSGANPETGANRQESQQKRGSAGARESLKRGGGFRYRPVDVAARATHIRKSRST